MLYRIITLVALALGGALLARQLQKSRQLQNAQGGQDPRNAQFGSVIRETVDVNVPVRVAYDQWTQFEDFPRFMEGVHEVRQLDDQRLHWRAAVFGNDIEWDAQITEQIPDQKIAWRSISGTPNSGSLTFAGLSRSRTRITLDIAYPVQDGVEALDDALGAVRLQARNSLKQFKQMIELRGQESGAWRGAVAPQTQAGSA